MAKKEMKKRPDKPVQLMKARLSGRHYDEDKPKDCRYCYFWAGLLRGCSRKECWYLIPSSEKVKSAADATPECKTCPYRRLGPCIGYCIAQIEREVFSKTRGWKIPAAIQAEVMT